MFAFLKNLLRKPQDVGAEQVPMPPAWSPAEPPVQQSSPAPARAHSTGRGLEIPLKAVVAGLPLELQPCVINANFHTATIAVPLERVLSQLSKGCVKISFGELRAYAAGVFANDASRDQTMISLPLGEIIARLNPALIERRRVQKHVSVPDEISSPFDALTGAPAAPAAVSQPPPEIPVNRLGQKPPLPHGPGEVTLPPIHPVAPVVPAAPAAPANLNGRTSSVSAPTPQPPSISTPGSHVNQMRPVSRNLGDLKMQAPVVPPRNGHTNGNSVPAPAPASAAATPKPVQAPAQTEPALIASLASLAEHWPDAIRKEIVECRLVDAKVSLPYAQMGEALKKARILFPWKTVRSWITPPPAQDLPATHAGTVIELPLKVVAPLYIANQQARTKHQQKIVVDEDIPNLFFGFPQPESATAAAAATARPEDTNYYVWDDVSEAAKVDQSEAKKTPTPGTRFVSKYATPNEVVSKAASLDGVAGALIALPDGLMVASRLPTDLNGDTLAAFLPQIFGKVSQCTKELRMGDLNNLNFTVGNVPWKIFRVNSVFFAAFGRSGSPLPTSQLAALAAELDHKPRT